jgi:hypothetical protein
MFAGFLYWKRYFARYFNSQLIRVSRPSGIKPKEQPDEEQVEQEIKECTFEAPHLKIRIRIIKPFMDRVQHVSSQLLEALKVCS